jgi:hypothetical protein
VKKLFPAVLNSLDVTFTPNSGIHTISTRHSTDLHPLLLHLSKTQKSVYFSGIKIFNYLPQYVKELSHDVTQFRYTLKNFSLGRLILFA